jgi:hypothetical protein
MAKTKYQEAAMKYAEDYLERILKMEDLVGHNVEKRLNKMVEQKFLKFEERYKKNNDE